MGQSECKLTFTVQIDWLSLTVAHDAEASAGDVGKEGKIG